MLEGRDSVTIFFRGLCTSENDRFYTSLSKVKKINSNRNHGYMQLCNSDCKLPLKSVLHEVFTEYIDGFALQACPL